MHVRDGMSTEVLMIGPDHSLREASRAMAARRVGAAVVHDPGGEGVGILTERDVLHSVGAPARTPTSSTWATTSPTTSSTRPRAGPSSRPRRR